MPDRNSGRLRTDLPATTEIHPAPSLPGHLHPDALEDRYRRLTQILRNAVPA